MRRIIVPAEMTSIEDRVSARLSFKQLILLMVPIIILTMVCTIVPPFLSVTAPKAILVSIMSLPFSIGAIRYRGELLGVRAMLRARFALRPRRYIYDKRSPIGRTIDSTTDVMNDTTEAIYKEATYETTDTSAIKA